MTTTTETVVILTSTSTGADSTGEPIPGPDAQQPHECVVWPASGSEDLQVGVNGTVDEWVVAFPPGTVVPADARAVIRAERFNAVTRGFDYTNPFTGERPGTVVTFRRVGTGG